MSVFPLPRRAAAKAPDPAAGLAAALPMPIVVLDAGGAVTFANIAAQGFLNASLWALRERGFVAALAPGSPTLALIDRARTAGHAVTAYDTEVGLAGGRTVRADVFVTPLPDGGAGTMVSFQARSVPTLVDRARAGEGAARSAIGVAAMLAHEIKNPLSGIRGAAQLLGQSAGDDEARELTTLIQREVDRVVALIDRMEGFTDTRPVARTPHNIHAVLDHVRQVAASGFARGIPIRERYDPSLPAVAGSYDALVQLFLNLVKNAAEAITAGGAGGEITLTTAYRHGFRAASGLQGRRALPLEVCVVDSGPGPGAGLAAHMFEPFVSSKPAGGGLGLALVAKIVGDHGGVVEFERAADPPRTILRVLLPVA